MQNKINCCRVCGNKNLEIVLDLGIQKLTGIFPVNKEMVITSGPLQLVKCHGDGCCGLVQLAHEYNLDELYGENYGYRSGLNQSMVKHLNEKVEKIKSIINFENGDLVIDIGSNDGTTLGFYPEGLDLVGIDPSGEKFQHYYQKRIMLISDFFTSKLICEKFQNKKAKVITSFSMFYDLEAPLEFMKQIELTLDDEGIWVFEQSYMPFMLENNSYDTVCQEHLEYYALKQIEWMCAEVGLKILSIEFNDINGGSFSIVSAKECSTLQQNSIQIREVLEKEINIGLDTLLPWQEFKSRIEETKIELLSFLKKCKKDGKKVFGLGASTKGNVLLQYCGITDDLLPVIGEVNKDKFGCFTPGSNIPIVSEDEVIKANPDYLLVLPWHFKEFFVRNNKFNGINLVFPLPKLEFISK